MRSDIVLAANTLRAAMVSALRESGDLSDGRWINAFSKIPRHNFVPRFLVQTSGGTREICADDDEDLWLKLVYADEALAITADQYGPTSSSSQPSLMAAMLESLRCTGDERVLEIGTGTGYNAALLCNGLSDRRVSSIDIDGGLIDQARARLSDLGYSPDLATGDGEAGYPVAAPFDRLIATCSVARVPLAWLRQMRPGGLVLANLYRDFGGGALALLTVDAHGEASGHFEPYCAGFMPSRNVSRTRAVDLLPDHGRTVCTEARQTHVVATMLEDSALSMLSALHVEAQQVTLLPDDRAEEFWLVSPDGSWACQSETGNGQPTVRQGGPIKIWERIESVYETWAALGRPERETFGLTVSPTGRHTIWHGEQAHPLWVL